LSEQISMAHKAGQGRLIVISGPSGVGKGTICEAVLKRDPQLRMSVSATTRAPRPGEEDGVHYHFVSREAFERMIRADELLEYMDVFGMNYYGTPAKFVDDALEEGYDVILEIEVNGARNVKHKRPEAIAIFIAPPSMRALHERLEHRGTETAEQIDRRYAIAHMEMACLPEYDYLVINDDVARAEADVACIIRAERLRTCRSYMLHDILKED